MNRMDLPSSAACSVPMGVNTPWLMALLRNSTLAGSTSTAVRGSRLWSTRKPTPAPSTSVIFTQAGPMTKMDSTASTPPIMPTEKLLTTISKPAGTWPSIFWSNFLMHQPPRGPQIIAPMNMVLLVEAMAPRVASAPVTAPFWPPTALPPV